MMRNFEETGTHFKAHKCIPSEIESDVSASDNGTEADGDDDEGGDNKGDEDEDEDVEIINFFPFQTVVVAEESDAAKLDSDCN